LEVPAAEMRVERGVVVQASWRLHHGTGDSNRSLVLVSPGKDMWWPASALIMDTTYEIDTGPLEPGEYALQIAVVDGVDVLRSGVRSFRVN
jgi:hypothetical protein